MEWDLAESVAEKLEQSPLVKKTKLWEARTDPQPKARRRLLFTSESPSYQRTERVRVHFRPSQFGREGAKVTKRLAVGPPQQG